MSAEDVPARLGIDPAVGLSAEQAAELLARDGPNALPVEQPVPGWRRFAGQYRSYMQMILLGAAIVSLAIKEWSTGVLLLLITVLNATVSLRQEGKAESAMNALKSMVKATARIRRDEAEAQIDAEQVVIGDVVLLAAGDEVPADGRIIQASSLQIDESALTGESVPASKGVGTPEGTDLAPGEHADMPFMHAPVTHGSGVMRLYPRPSSESIMTNSLKLTPGLVGVSMAIVLDALIYIGKEHYHSTAIGSSTGLTAFALMLVVAAYESRSVTLSALASETFDNRSMNWMAVAEIALAVTVTQMDLFNGLLGTVPLTAAQFGLALAAAVLLLALWEIGKLIARRQVSTTESPISRSSSAPPRLVVDLSSTGD